MESDAGLVQNVADSHQPGADLSGKADPLGLPSRQAARPSGQGEVFQPNIHQKAYSGPNFPDDALSYEHLLAGEFQVLQETVKLPNGHRSDLMDVLSADCHRQRFLLQAHSLAFLAGRDPHEAFVFLLHGLGKSLPILPLHIPHQTLEGHGIDALSPLPLIMYLHLFAVRSMDQNIFHFLRIFTEGGIQIEMIFFAQRLQQRVGKAVFFAAGLPAHDGNSPLADAETLIRDHQVDVEFHLIAQSRTHGAGSERIVEGEASWLDLTDAYAAVRAGKALAEGHRLTPYDVHHQQIVRKIQHIFYRICQTALHSLLHRQPIHHDVNVVLNILLQRDLFRQLVHTAVYAHTHIAALSGSVQHLGVFALAPSDHRGQQLQLCTLRQLHDLIHHLIHRLLGYLPSAIGTVRNSYSGIKQTEIIINLRDGSHCRPGIPIGGFLIYGDGRGKPLDPLHIRFLHLSQKHSGVGGQRLHIPTLALRIDGVEGQRGLAGS